jgi:hypothetical protein
MPNEPVGFDLGAASSTFVMVSQCCFVQRLGMAYKK